MDCWGEYGVRKQVFERGLGFDEKLGRNGSSSLLSNDETELFEAIGKIAFITCLK